MPFDTGQWNQSLEDQIAALQPQTKPQGGVLNQIDPTWLALAQGFLAPTKTGGFGESLSNAAGQLQGPLAKMREQQMTAQDKINNLRQLQMKMQLDWYKAQKGDNDENDYINNEYKRAQALNTYSNMYDRLKNNYMDITGTKFVSPEKEEEFKQKSKPILDAMEALQTRSRPGGASSIEGATGTGQGNRPITIPNENVKSSSAQPQGQPSLKEGDIAYNPQGIRFIVKNGKLVQDQKPGQR